MTNSRTISGRRTHLLVGVLLGGTTIAGAQARADVTDQLLDRLQEKGILSKAEYRAFKTKHRIEVRAARERPQTATREIITKDGGRIVPVEDDIVRALKIKDKGIGAHVGDVDVTLSET